MLRPLLCLLTVAALIPAQDAPPPVAHGSFGIDFATAYFFRGIQQENQGIIAQPWIELGYGLHEADEGLRSVDLVFGLWNSLHDGPTGGAGGIWYESDFYTGLSADVGERMSVGATYTVYHSPNGTFGTVEELAFSGSYDDAGLDWSPVASGLQPSVVLAFELDGQADAGTHVGVYAQLGVEPSFAIGQLGGAEVTLSLPVTLGLSLRDYYEVAGDDDFFGFLDVGGVASAPMSFLPPGMGPWQGSVGLHLLLLGDNLETINDNDAYELIFSFGASTSF
ncbi:MAG: hypothetical protein JNL08_02470 [Planctomycetes bacterium]|nr:hypothetical protein [Planctomycetota bacterium]